MPGVDVFYRYGVMSPEVADAIKETVRRYGASTFSTSEIELSESDFSFKFYRPEKYDELTNDLIVRIRLHHFSKRLEDTDGDAAGMALLIGSALSKVEDFDPTRTVGLEILVCEIGWGSATVMRGKVANGLAQRAIAGSVQRPGRAQMSSDE
jgi:hypothetical protein